jgi:SPOR domain
MRIGSHSGVGVPRSPEGCDKARNSMCWARGTTGFASFTAPDLGGNLLTLGQIHHATLKMNDYYPVIARAVERLDTSTGEARRAVYERARKAVAQLRSNQPTLLDADITKERLALEEAIRKVEAEAARKSPPETRAEPRSAAPSEGMPDSDKIQSRDHGQPASSDRDGRPPALSSRQAPIFLPTTSDDRHNTDIQAVGGAHGADHYYYDDVPGSRWRGGLLIVMAVLALAMLAGTFAYRGMFSGYTFPALPPIVIAGTGPINIVRNNSDTRWSNSSQTSVTSAGSSEELQPIDIREAPKTVPRVISNIPISSRPSAGPVAPAPAATASALDPALDQHVAPSVPPPASAAPMPALAQPALTAAPVPPSPASAPAPVSASSEPSGTAAVAPAAPTPALAQPVLTAAPVPPPASAPAPVSDSSEPSETAAVAPAAPMPALAQPVFTAAPVPPSPASAPAPVSASSEPSGTAAVPSVAREPRAPSPALAPPVFTAAPPASAPVMVPASSEPTEIQTVMVAPGGRGGTNTSSPPALAPHSATRAAVRQNAAAASPVGNHDAQKDAAPSPSSRSRMRAGRGTPVKVSSGGAYAVQVASERSAAEARASFRALRAKFPNQLGGREPIVRRTDLGAKGIYYRTMVGSFASMEKAAGMCRTLKAAGGNCRVQRN